MKTMSKKKCFMLLGLLAGLALIITPVVILAGGQSGSKGEKPGASCETAGDYKYLPPPYLGMVTLIFEPSDPGLGGELFLTGEVAKVGKSDCKIVVETPYHFDDFDGDVADFLELKPGDIGGTCIENLSGFFTGECTAIGFIQLVGAGNQLQFETDCPGGIGTCWALKFNAVAMDLVDLSP